MINLQNPLIPVRQDEIEIDKVITAINTKLADNIAWITHNYGRAYKSLDNSSGRSVIVPLVYLGKQGNNYNYTNISPDNDKQGQCFFIVEREDIQDFQSGNYNLLTYDIGIIFSLNLELINESLLSTDYYLQNCVAEVRNCLTRQLTGGTNNLVLDSIEFDFSDVFRGFNINEQQVLEKSPLTHFRVNGTVTIEEDCILFNPPLTLPTVNLSMHLDAAKGVNNSTPVNGELVNLWVDQSGLNNNVLQGTVSSQPTYLDQGINDLPTIQFNGSYLETSTLPVMAGDSYSVWVVVEKTGAATGSPVLGNVFMLFANAYGSVPANYMRLSEGFFTSTQYSIDSTGTLLDDDLAANTVGTPYLFGIVKDGNDFSYYVNENIVHTATVAATGAADYGSIGSWNNSNFTGQISEMAIYSEGNSTATATEIVNYFKGKYNL